MQRTKMQSAREEREQKQLERLAALEEVVASKAAKVKATQDEARHSAAFPVISHAFPSAISQAFPSARAPHTRRVVCFLSGHAYRMLFVACDPMLFLIPVCRPWRLLESQSAASRATSHRS